MWKKEINPWCVVFVFANRFKVNCTTTAFHAIAVRSLFQIEIWDQDTAMKPCRKAVLGSLPCVLRLWFWSAPEAHQTEGWEAPRSLLGKLYVLRSHWLPLKEMMSCLSFCGEQAWDSDTLRITSSEKKQELQCVHAAAANMTCSVFNAAFFSAVFHCVPSRTWLYDLFSSCHCRNAPLSHAHKRVQQIKACMQKE